MNSINDLLEKSPGILAECAIAERLRRLPEVMLHPTLFNTPLIYGPAAAKAAMTSIYQEYIATAAKADLPLLLTAPTWRLDHDRIENADVPGTINTDAVDYLLEVRNSTRSSSAVLVGALTGPRNDCYLPAKSPAPHDAENFHAPQIEELASTHADFLLAQTLPAVGEALGVAKVMSATEKPYIISFCTGTDGNILDGTKLTDAFDMIDLNATRPPLGYFVNCTHPRFLTHRYQAGELLRLIGIQANASSKDVTQLDNSSETVADRVDDWASAMLELHTTHQVPILGGCCGTDLSHMQHLAAAMR